VADRHQPAQTLPGSAFPGTRTGSGTFVFTVRKLAIGALRAYKLVVSPMLPSACRFYPTCSVYMSDAIQKYGLRRGLWMGLKRLGKCHPFHAGGYDPVR
jgi:putative membrane protein insertion efficiency factor